MPSVDIVGHRQVISLLTRSIAGGSLPPSLIFSGPEGVGKRLIAVRVAQALNCIGPADKRTGIGACGTCAACSRIARGVHPDVLVIEPGDTGAIKIEPIREAIDRTMYRPFEGRKRVTIIDDADAMMPPPQNALLKTLEEPNAASVFILITSRPDALLPTVRSRCSHIRFGRLSAPEVAQALERDHGYARRDALAVAASANGSIRQALEVEAGEFAEARSDVEGLLRDARRSTDARTRVERAKSLMKGGGSAAATEREHLGMRLQALSSLARDLGMLAAGADPRWLANADLHGELKQLAASFDGERALRLFSAVDRAQTALDRNVSPKVVADWLALHI